MTPEFRNMYDGMIKDDQSIFLFNKGKAEEKTEGKAEGIKERGVERQYIYHWILLTFYQFLRLFFSKIRISCRSRNSIIVALI